MNAGESCVLKLRERGTMTGRNGFFVCQSIESFIACTDGNNGNKMDTELGKLSEVTLLINLLF